MKNPPRSDLTSMLKSRPVAWIPQGKLQSLKILCCLRVVDPVSLILLSQQHEVDETSNIHSRDIAKHPKPSQPTQIRTM